MARPREPDATAPRSGAGTYRGSGRLAGKKALITGGDSGIGRAVAIAFAAEAADLAISYLPEEQSDAEEAKRIVESAGRRCILLPGDMQDEAFCRDIVGTTAAELGGLDILANIARGGHRARVPHERVRDVLALPGGGAREAGCLDHQHRLDPGLPAEPVDPALFIQQGAIATFTKGLAQELAPQGFRVKGLPSSTSARRRRSAAPASRESSYVTGMIYGATGGEITA